MIKRIVCILLAGVLICLTLTAGFAKDTESRVMAAEKRTSAANSIESSEGDEYNQALEVLWIDEWGSVWIGESELKSTLKRMAESLDAVCLPTIGAVICSGTTPNAVFLDFSVCEVLFELELLDRQYGETAEVSRYAGRSAIGEMEFLITTENYLNMQSGHGELTASYEGVSLRF